MTVTANPLAPARLGLPDDANVLDPAIWSRGTERLADGRISIAGLPADELAATFGTPLYAVDEADVRGRAAETRAAFEEAFAPLGSTATVYYAGKAFLCTEVVRWIRDAGLHLDVCSGGELAVALAGGMPPTDMGFHGNNKSEAEIERAVSLGIGSIVLDSLAEIERVADAAAQAGRRQAVRLRVQSGVHASTHEYLATAHEDQKFGLALRDVPDAVARIRAHDELLFLGLHCHNGSQIFGSEGLEETARRVLAVHAALLEGGPVPELNLGGGFGIAYVSTDDPTPIREIAAALAASVGAACASLGIPVPDVSFEPGRSIVGPSTATLYTVGTVKPVRVTDEATRVYVSVDGGMSDNIRTALYGADYSARIAQRASDAEPALVRVAGKHCESGDIVVDAEYLPGDVRAGDLLAVPATGAYCFALANTYNYITRPAVVAVQGGEARLIVRRETVDDLLARDMGVAETSSTSTDESGVA